MNRTVKVLAAVVYAALAVLVFPVLQGLLGKPLESWAGKHGPIVVVIALVLGAPLVVFTARQLLRGDSRRAGGSLPEVMNRLARVVRDKWRKEAKKRDVYGHGVLLPGHWSPTGRDVTDGTGAHAAGAERVRLDSPGAMVAAFRRQQAPRLVVLGEPGAGKSTVALLLTLGLLNERVAEADAAEHGESTEPVPVLLTLASWDPGGESLDAWVKRRLVEDHPFLRDLPVRYDGEDVLQGLLDDGALLPVLDGMDEIKRERRTEMITFVKRSRLPRLVLTCRAREYERAVADGQDTLAGAAVIELEPVVPADAIEFISRGLHQRRRERWQPVFDSLRDRPRGPLARAFSTPLMISLARQVYRGRSTDPGELADESRFPTRARIAGHLLEGLIATAFPSHPASERQRWKGDDARRWLTCLAELMHGRHVSEIAWWELSQLAPRPVRILIGLAGGVMGGAAIGLGFGGLAAHRAESAVAGWAVGGAFGLITLIVLGIASARNAPAPSVLHFGVTGRRRAALASGLIVGAIGGGVGLLLGGPGFAVVVGMLCGGPIGLVYGLAAPDATEDAVAPRHLLVQDRRVALTFGMVYALTVGMVGGYGIAPPFGVVIGAAAGLAGGLMYGPVWAFSLDKGKAGVVSWLHLLVVRLWYAPRGRLPWRLMDFLEAAHDRGVLRRSGAVYHFRHAFLQDVLAGVPPRPESTAADD
ncbi:NACHT domain-containing protein [Actinomadura sp. HBU206391]|uniref:NACHT domain-containing protein n=1 Tax=Actinomadura sp. HBU206391 TaxID=2731692 RepID=UPI001650C220|nr:hypothetical protein [Actinomadura sp. HBU206391]MBC6459985.1 hypothetical protein [Actinomadura sp. HBU206391]